jgi:class 3 adenylate cyclase/tetratricopeptide (TPR) repeat protein
MQSSDLCRQCGVPVQRGSRFCPSCGQAMEPGSADSERRQLSVLFCDLAGSTSLSERLDPEDLHDLLTSYRAVCRDSIGDYEGHISQYFGDGVMSYFGYPIAHEDDAVRAVRAALRIVESIALVNQGIGKRLQAEIQVRVGIHTGVAVVGELGPGGVHDRLASGEAVNLAARIQAFAPVNTVLVSASTAGLVEGHFELLPLPVQSLKGFTRPVQLFQVVRATPARTRFEAAARGKLTPQVGREKELAELDAAWAEVRESGDRVVVVRGEPGIGKSRIVHDFRHARLAEGVHVLECFCSPLTSATALAPITATLMAVITQRAQGDSSAEARLRTLGELLGEHSRFGPDALPLMAAVLSIPGADQSPVEELSPVRRRVRTLEILRDWMVSSTERIPLALFVEDIHWADPSTLDLLDLIVSENGGGRLLLCVTARPEFRLRWSQPHVRTVEILRLTQAEIEAMVQHVARGHVLPALVVSRIAERSEGVPLFVEEVTKAVLESGALRLEGDRYELIRPLDERVLPSTVQGSLVARFDRLGESRQVAHLAAAIGREFSYPLIRAVARLPDQELCAHLDRLSGSELAFVHGVPPTSVYIFKHALIQDAIYGTLLKGERAKAHDRIFTALQAEFPEVLADRPEVAAYHAENAGRRESAVPLLREAGLKALARTAVAEAVKHLALGIALVDVLEQPARTSVEIELQAAIGPAYMATVGWAAPEVERASARLRELAAAKGDGPRLFQAMWGLWTVYFLRGKLDPALEVGRQVLGMAEGAGDPLLRVAGHHALGYTHFYRGEYQEALGHAAAGLALFDFEREKQIASVFQFSSSCALWFFRAQSQHIIGDGPAAAESLLGAQELAEQLRHAPSRAYLLCQLCYYFHVLDDVDQVKAWAPEMRSLSIAEGFALWVPLADIFLAWANARQGGDAAAAAEKIQAALTLVHDSGTYLNEPDLASMYAETLLLAGKPERALAIADEALGITQLGCQRHCQPELLRFKALAEGAMGNSKKSIAFFREAIESAGAMGATLLELRSTLALARVVGGNQVRDRLRTILDRVTGSSQQRDYRDYNEALALLDEMGDPGNEQNAV